ncbi:MAG: acetate--CoA ligase [Pseudomonadota bacterium]
MSMQNLYPVDQKFAQTAHINQSDYRSLYQKSLSEPDLFWAEQASKLQWITPFSKVSDVSYNRNDLHIRWFEDGCLNVSENCIDRHLPNRADQTAIIWEGDRLDDSKTITYRQLHQEVSKFANVLKQLGIKKQDRVVIYMPMIVEAAYAMLACARIGAVHSVVFGGFSPDALASRINDCQAKAVITADEGVRGGKKIPLKANVDVALEKCPDCKICLVVEDKQAVVEWYEGRDFSLYTLMQSVDIFCPAEKMSAEDPLFILYTSGSTGKPKGVLHTQAGYLLYAAYTHQLVFDYKDGDIYWCTADVGWITGHSYIVYGPLCNGATTLMFEGVPNYPDHSRFWQICDKHKVNIFYTAPTAIRALMREGDDWVKKTSRKTLRLLGTVGEPINPEAWRWYYEVVGESKCPIMDTWWQTETGGILISPLAGAIDLKPGSATLPFLGVEPVLLDTDGRELENACEGNLCLKRSWPGQMRTLYGDHKRFIDTYFSDFEGYYFTGDGAKRDQDGYYWITGRVDDVLNVAGHRLGTAEIESALVLHESVSEAAVVGAPHPIKGQAIYAYVTLKNDVKGGDSLKKELIQWVRKQIGPISTPEWLQWAPSLPKTRSGKIMRRILRKIAENDYQSLGDISTLADSSVVHDLIENRLNKN